MKSPSHPVPSGDRQMARALIAAFEEAGYPTLLASQTQTHVKSWDLAALAALKAAHLEESRRLAAAWQSLDPAARPAIWVTYHPYYKSPDWLGPAVAAALDIPYVTIEASYAGKRDRDAWAPWQAEVKAGLAQAQLHFCFTAQDREGLLAMGIAPHRLADLPPFIDAAPFLVGTDQPARGAGPCRLVCVGMMRPGDKLRSYETLARALAPLDRPEAAWQLHVIGDGPASGEVTALFNGFAAGRIIRHGRLEREAVANCLAAADVYVWPGHGEAYGIAYLEAQAAGLPVVALDTGGVSAVVVAGRTGILTTPDDLPALTDAIAALIAEPQTRQRMGRVAAAFVADERSPAMASARIKVALVRLLSQRQHQPQPPPPPPA